MGYYYTPEPEAAPRAISCASPKTHTPASPVKERGHRYYMPEVGRWLSRDPIGENGFELSSCRTLSKRERLIRKLIFDLAIVEPFAPTLVRDIKIRLIGVGLDLFCGELPANLNIFVKNAPTGSWDPIGLSENGITEDKAYPKCCPKDAQNELIEELINVINDQATKFPGTAGQAAKIIKLLLTLKSANDCAAKKELVTPCQEYIDHPSVSSCMECCQKIFALGGNTAGGVGVFTCSAYCDKSQPLP